MRLGSFRIYSGNCGSGGVWQHMAAHAPTSISQYFAWSECLWAVHWWVPPAGFEPALTAPEAVALSPELRGLKDRSKVTSPGGAGSPRTAPGLRPGSRSPRLRRREHPAEDANLAPVAQGL